MQGARRREYWDIRKPSNAADALYGRNPKGRQRFGRMALSLVACLGQLNGTPRFAPYTQIAAVAHVNKSDRLLGLLDKAYPDAGLALNFSNPLELLVAVILSAQCTDARVNEVTQMLFRKYRSARDYAKADPVIFEQEIRSTGFYRNKAKLVMGCCEKLVKDFGGNVPASLEALTRLPGVGRKTANMVLGNAFGVPGIAVDTHVLRVSNRLGLADSGDPEKVEAALNHQIPQARWTFLSNALILHGRQVCTAKKPLCGRCLLFSVCEWPDKGDWAAKTG
jgi:endonuclease III